ncbi:MAG: N-6 DNA methylase, partial [Chloroflexota bacterium]
MATDLKLIHDYIKAIEKELAAGNTTEHTHRPALKTLLESLNPAITATNEPQHITDVGAVDFRIIKNKLATGYVECKDIGINLDEALKTDQLQRYLKAFHNLVLTNYLEFRWYVHGEHRLTVWLGDVKNNKVKPYKDGLQKTAELLDSFLKHEPEPINNPKELAQHMARLAHMMGYIINNTLKAETATGSLHAQLIAFRENLIPELPVGQFADMYAQTIAYGLFAARCETDKGKDFTRQNAAYLLPKTNPFLRKLFSDIAGPGLDERLVETVDDLAQILAQADMAAILEGFGKSAGKDDPVVHFYETFLKEYDPKTREMRGVYYTPLPVVSYIVRSIDHLLKTRFEKPQGLADSSVLVLDPAVGTATFLYVVMQEIHDAVVKQGQAGTWNEYVAGKLLPRLFGFELLMAPYAIAHLKLGLLLKETGYDIETDKRLNIYLTNTLDEAVKKSEQLAGFNEYIVEEANAAAEIKKEKPIMVVLGNPPYSVSSLNRGEWIDELIEDYKHNLNEKKLNLDDDYIKFIRFAQWRIEQTGYGILGFITNNSYLDGLTHRRMREYLLESFSSIYILNLHGS